jgi:ferredoxin-NADP reductase
MDYNVTLLMSEFVTHDVKRFIVSRPEGFDFTPGEAVELAIDDPKWRNEGRPFTPTSLAEDQVIEFTIKGYPDHEGVTQALHALHPGARLLMSAPFGTIRYRGLGTFIAGGAGITPFIAILRALASQGNVDGHSLIFANKTPADIICEKELRSYLGIVRCHLICTDVEPPGAGYEYGKIDKTYLRDTIGDFGQSFYLCGPPGFMDVVTEGLKGLGADPQALVFEQ